MIVSGSFLCTWVRKANYSTCPAIDKAGQGTSKSSPIQSEKFLHRTQTNPQFFATWTELAWTALDQSIGAESAPICWELLIYFINI